METTASELLFMIPNPRFDRRYLQKDHQGFTPQTRALAFCMYACGVFRLFTPHDMQQLVTRLPIVLKHLNILDDFFGNDYLFRFIHEQEIFTFSVDDLVAHAGLHISRFPRTEIPFEVWQQDCMSKLSNVCFMALFANLIIPRMEKLVTIQLEDEGFSMKFTAAGNEHPDDILKNARLLANTLMKEIPGNTFDNVKVDPRLTEIEEYFAYVNSPLPVAFSWERIPGEGRKYIRDHFAFMYSADIPEDASLEQIDQITGMPVSRLVYLAWLNANGLVYDLFHGEFDPQVKVDIFDYEIFGDGAGVNMDNIYSDYDLFLFHPYLEEECEF